MANRITRIPWRDRLYFFESSSDFIRGTLDLGPPRRGIAAPAASFLFTLLPRFAPALLVGKGFADPTCSSIRWIHRCNSSSRWAPPPLLTSSGVNPIETKRRHLSRGTTILRLLTCSSPPMSASTYYFKVTQCPDWTGLRKCRTAKRYFSNSDEIIGRDSTRHKHNHSILAIPAATMLP